MRTYEIYPLDNPGTVLRAHIAEGPEEALEKEAAQQPECIYDTTLLTLINRHGAFGVRAARSDGCFQHTIIP